MKIIQHYPADDGTHTAVVEDDSGNRYTLSDVGAMLELSDAEEMVAQRLRDQYARATSAKAESAKDQLNTADFDAAKKSIEAASSVDDLKSTLALLVELVGRLAEAQGLEPKTPAAAAGG